jgi:hypothetical protein
MDMDTIKISIAKICEIRGDDERAHSWEDVLYQEFVKYIAERKDHLGKMAREILKTQKIDFSRWCA